MASQQQFLVTQVGNKNNANPRLLISESWISDKNPTYPQDLELTLRYPMDLERLEIISHNQFIPSRLELMMKNGASHKSVGEVLFKHKKSERHELKTVYLDDRCTQLLFRIHGNHEHDENPNNQVGLVEVKVFGSRVPDAEENPNYKKQGGTKAEMPASKNKDKKYTRELEDLNRAVNKNKERCVQEDNFRLAKQAQLAERLIAKSIGEMRQLEDDKEEAIAEEDYQRAADLTEEMKTLRAHVLASIDTRLTENVPSDPDTHRQKTGQARPDGLFDGEEPIPYTSPKLYTPVDLSPDNDTRDFLKPPRKPSSQGSTRSVSSRRPRYSIPQPNPPAPPSRRRRSYERVTFRPSSKDSIISRRSNSSARSTRPNKFMEKENMVVPAALKNRQRKIEDEESGNIRNLPSEGDDHYLAVTTPKEHGDATRAAGALGVKTMNKIFSRNFESRKEGLAEAREIVQNANDENSRAVFDAMVFVLGKALRDPLYSVYSEALDLLKVTVCEFMPRHQMQKNGSAIAATTVEPLLAKMGNTAGDKRTPQETESVFREIVNSNEKVAKGYLPPVMNSAQSGNKAEKARADIIYQSINKYSAPNAQAGLAEDTLRRYGVKCLMSTNTDVRNVGREIVLRLYEKGDKRAVRSALPIGGKRGSLIQDIQREMDVIDRSGR